MFRYKRSLWTAGMLILMLLGGCGVSDFPEAGASGNLQVWLDQPVHGSSLPLEAFTLKAHARNLSGGGVEVIAFRVNQEMVGQVETDAGSPLVHAELEWTPAEAGEYVIEALASSGGAANASGQAHICVSPASEPLAFESNGCRPLRATAVRPTLVPTASTTATTSATPSASPSAEPTATETASPIVVAEAPTFTRTRVPPPRSTNTVVRRAPPTWTPEPPPPPPDPPTWTPEPPPPPDPPTWTPEPPPPPDPPTWTPVPPPPPDPPTWTPVPPDTTPPEILRSSANAARTSYGPSAGQCGPAQTTILAEVRDDKKVAEVRVRYRYASRQTGALGWHIETMRGTGGTSYQYTINVAREAGGELNGNNGWIEYQVVAEDTSGNVSRTGFSNITVTYCVIIG